MIATDQLHNELVSPRSKSTKIVAQPFLELGICSNNVTPMPPSEKPSRHKTISKGGRRNRIVNTPRNSLKHDKLASLRKDFIPHYKSIGFEIQPEKFIWRGWEVGEEYTKTLIMKNTSFQTKKIKYKPPNTSVFTTIYPQPVLISPGTTFTLPITFKPLEKVKYEEKIEFFTPKGRFSLPLLGLLPEISILIPDKIRFGLSAVHEVAELSFEIQNTSGEVATDFAWDGPEPFSFTPRTGSLQPKSSAWIQATFRPTSATVYDASIVCFYGENMRKIMQAEGVGKYPHLSISSKPSFTEENQEKFVVDFDVVNMNESAEKFIYLRNLSNVKASFSLKRCYGIPQMDQVFTAHVGSDVVPPLKTIAVPITYSPHIPNRSDVDYFEVTTVGSVGRSVVQCIGKSKGVNMVLSTSLLNFGLVKLPEDKARRSFYIFNQSDVDVAYQFDLDQTSGIFRISETSGLLPARQSQQIIVTFNPTYCMNYYRKMILLVHEQGPLFMELIGTLHDQKNTPHSLESHHLDQYKVLSSRGLTFYPPDILRDQFEEGKLDLDEAGYYKISGEEEEKADKADSRDFMTEYFDDGHHTEVTSNPPHVSLDKMSIWFGELEYKGQEVPTTQTTLHLSNHTHGKVTACWVEDPSSPFKVIPSFCDVLPQKTVKFQVVFRPQYPNQLYGSQLECYVSYKISRDYQLIEEKSLSPPWLLTLDACGHTFNGRNENFYSDLAISSKKLVFAPVQPNESSYRTVLFENKGTTPYLYQFLKEKDAFTVKSSFGFSQSKYKINLVRFTPTHVNSHDVAVTLRTNDTSKFDKTINMLGTGEKPELLLSNCGELFFRPSCIHTSVSRHFEIRNVGRSVMYFRWVIPNVDTKCLSVEPCEGQILPNETQEHKWTFTPDKAKKYVFKAACHTWTWKETKTTSDLEVKDAIKYKLRIIGEGLQGAVRAEKYTTDFGSIIAGSTQKKVLTFYNDSHCDIHTEIVFDQSVNSQYGEDADENEPISLELSSQKCTIPARSTVTVKATVKPYRRVLYSWHLYYYLLNDNGERIENDRSYSLCELNADGVYPTLTIIDARPSGSGTSISKTQLWRWFSIDNLNSSLDSDPSPAELRYTISSRQSASRRPSTYTRSIMDFNFGAAGVGSDPCYVSMMVENTGTVATCWSFLFPKDLELEMDYWAETGVLNADELHELHIQDNKLFEVYPSKGVLHPGERRTILFTYKHDIPGTHRVPVLLKVEQGKEILLNFVGVTVQPDRRYLHFPGTRHNFNPVPLGELNPPKQLYEMFNGGSMSVMYEVDLAPLQSLETENYEHPILSCLNPKGEIPPGMSSNLEWIFSPLESKTYIVDIPIHIIGGETALISFQGIGYDTRAMGESMPKLDQPPEFTSVPSTQKVSVPGQILFLSEERISFGNLPLFGKARHVLFLTNQSDDRPISFSWHATSSVVNDVLSIEPIQGYLQPGQSSMVKIMFCASGQPSFYDLDLVCEVVDEIEVAEYHAEMEAWRAEKERQEAEFTIVADKQETREQETTFDMYSGPARYELSVLKQNIENILNKTPSPVRLTESDLSKDIPKSEFRMFQTLPPIRFEDPVKAPSNRSRLVRHQEAMSKNEWIRPEYPKPFIAHLGVTARTHDIAQFRTHFTGTSDKNFIDRTMQIDNPVAPKQHNVTQYSLTTCSESEKTMVAWIASDVIRGLLDDPTFHGSVVELSEEPTPYFGQLPREASIEEKDEEQQEENNVEKNQDRSPEILHQYPSEPNPGNFYAIKAFMSDMLIQSDPNEFTYSMTSPDTKLSSTEEIKRSPVFGSILEDVLSSTISNVMEEALKGEVMLTVRPRVVALPPSTNNHSPVSRKRISDSYLRSISSKDEVTPDSPSGSVLTPAS